jgi:hypothetical protein
MIVVGVHKHTSAAYDVFKSEDNKWSVKIVHEKR